MEICIIYFGGSRTASHALDSAMDRRAGEIAWIRDVTVIRRSARGRVTTRLADRRKKNDAREFGSDHERSRAAEIAAPDTVDASLPNPGNQAARTSADAVRVAELERDVIRIVELEGLLEPNSSALVLIAEHTDCDAMEATLALQSVRTYRHDVLADVDKTLRQLLESARGTIPDLDY